MDDSPKLEDPAALESTRKESFFKAETEEMSPQGGVADLTAKDEFEAQQPNSNAKSLAQDIEEDNAIGASEDAKNDLKEEEDSLVDSDSVVKTEKVAEESNCANDTSRTDDGNAICTGVSEKKEQENPIGSNQESKPDPYDFSDQDSPQRDDADTGRVSNNDIDVKMEEENNDEAGVVDDEHEDFDVEDKTWDFNQMNKWR